MRIITFNLLLENLKKNGKGLRRHSQPSAHSMHLLLCICIVIILEPVAFDQIGHQTPVSKTF